MATSLRQLKLPLNHKINTLRPNYFRILDKTVYCIKPKRTACFSVTQTGNEKELSSQRMQKAVINYNIIVRALQVRCISLLKTPLIDQAQENWQKNIEEDQKIPYIENKTIALLQNNTESWYSSPMYSSHTYDSLNLPIKRYDYWLDYANLNNENHLAISPVTLVENVSVTVFSGYLDSIRYNMYYFGNDKEFSSKLSEFEHYFVSSIQSMNSKKMPTSSGKPSEGQLKSVYLKLSDSLPKFFFHPLDYSMFHQDVVFENNIRGITTHGLAAYVKQMAMARILGHIFYAHVKLEVLKITEHPEDGSIKVRWRIKGISGLRVLVMFWKFKLWKWKEMMEKEVEWIDGFSIFYVGSDGLIYKHICDKMMPDEEKAKDQSTANIALKFALLLGLLPKPTDFGFLNNFQQQQLPLTGISGSQH